MRRLGVRSPSAPLKRLARISQVFFFLRFTTFHVSLQTPFLDPVSDFVSDLLSQMSDFEPTILRSLPQTPPSRSTFKRKQKDLCRADSGLFVRNLGKKLTTAGRHVQHKFYLGRDELSARAANGRLERVLVCRFPLNGKSSIDPIADWQIGCDCFQKKTTPWTNFGHYSFRDDMPPLGVVRWSAPPI